MTLPKRYAKSPYSVGTELVSVPTEYGDFAGLGEFAAQGLL
jgi:hypothetical protein